MASAPRCSNFKYRQMTFTKGGDSPTPANGTSGSPQPEGEALSIVIDRMAFDEDCARAEVVVRALSAPAGCRAKFVFDEKALARLGAVGLAWSDETGFRLASHRNPLQDRPLSPKPQPARDDRLTRPGHGTPMAPIPPTRRSSRGRAVGERILLVVKI